MEAELDAELDAEFEAELEAKFMEIVKHKEAVMRLGIRLPREFDDPFELIRRLKYGKLSELRYSLISEEDLRKKIDTLTLTSRDRAFKFLFDRAADVRQNGPALKGFIQFDDKQQINKRQRLNPPTAAGETTQRGSKTNEEGNRKTDEKATKDPALKKRKKEPSLYRDPEKLTQPNKGTTNCDAPSAPKRHYIEEDKEYNEKPQQPVKEADDDERSETVNTINGINRKSDAPTSAQQHSQGSRPASLRKRGRWSPVVVVCGSIRDKHQRAAERPATARQSAKRPRLCSPEKQPRNRENGKNALFEITEDEEYNEKPLHLTTRHVEECEEGRHRPQMSEQGKATKDEERESLQRPPARSLNRMDYIEFWNDFEKLVAEKLPNKWEAKQVVGYLGGCWQSKQDLLQSKQRPHLSAGGTKAMASEKLWDDAEEWMAKKLEDRWRAKEEVGFLGKCWHST